MKVLIAILSCAHHTLHGHNNALRKTWVKDVGKVSGLEYRFFLGDGTPSLENSSLLDMSWKNESPAYTKKRTFIDPSIVGYVPKEDEVLMKTSDRYEHMSYKVREALRWGSGNSFDYMFVCLTDTYVVPSRLMSSGFQNFDYCGTSNGEQTALGGGPGIWLSKKAASRVVPYLVTDWAYDRWLGEVMRAEGIKLQHDPRYTSLDLGDEPPLPTNDVITSHISNCDRSVYDIDVMYKLHQNYKGVQHV
jgi:hypothetical protein